MEFMEVQTQFEQKTERWDYGFDYAPTDPLVALQNLTPHYTDERYRYPQTVYRAPNVKRDDSSLGYEYDDRLWEWNYKKAEESSDAAKKEVGNNNTVMFFSNFLTRYFGKVIVVKHIMVGWNWSNGFSYKIFGY
jgi:hypothetical protein